MSRLLRGVAAVALVGPVLVAAAAGPRSRHHARTKFSGQFNAVVSNNFSTNSDVEGRLVAGNINNGRSSTFYENPNPLSAPSAFRGVNALTIQNCPGCNVNNGGGVNFVTSNSGTFNLNGGGSVSQNNPVLRDERLHHAAQRTSDRARRMASNSTFNNPNTNSLILTSRPSSGVAVFDMTAAELAGGQRTIITSRSRTRPRRRRSSSTSLGASPKAAAKISTAIRISTST